KCIDLATANYDQIQNVRDQRHDLKDSGRDTVHDTNFNFNEVTFKYPTGNRNSLENITLELNKGETLGIVGKTGSGKSTFIKQLLKIYPEGTGNLIIDGLNISTLDRKKDRKSVV